MSSTRILAPAGIERPKRRLMSRRTRPRERIPRRGLMRAHSSGQTLRNCRRRFFGQSLSSLVPSLGASIWGDHTSNALSRGGIPSMRLLKLRLQTLEVAGGLGAGAGLLEGIRELAVRERD